MNTPMEGTRNAKALRKSEVPTILENVGGPARLVGMIVLALVLFPCFMGLAVLLYARFGK